MTSKEFTVTHKERLVNELIDFLKLKSVSADPAFAQEVKVTASFVKDRIVEAGMSSVEICETAGHPIVYAEHIIDSSLPTVLGIWAL